MGKFFAEAAARLAALAGAATAAARAFEATPAAAPPAVQQAARERAALALAAVAQGAGPDSGVELCVRLDHGEWREACLLGRDPGSADAAWRVFFYDTAHTDSVQFWDIDRVQVEFAPYALRERVEVSLFPGDGGAPQWYGGQSVQLAPGDATVAVMFDDGDWGEGLCVTLPYIRRKLQPQQAQPPAAKLEPKAAKAAASTWAGVSGRPLRSAMLRNLGKSYVEPPRKREAAAGAAAAAGAGSPLAALAAAAAAARARARLPPKFEIERVCGVKKLNRECYYKVSWAGWGPEHDTWERGRQLSRDTGVGFLMRLVKAYRSAGSPSQPQKW